MTATAQTDIADGATTDVVDGWETVVGLEVHVELNTNTKMFCGCATDFGAPANTRVCPVCSGQPGALPVVNRAAVESAARLGLALDCEVAETSRFHRKNYFYPDLAKNYQISQYDVPLCADGHLDVQVGGDGDPRRTHRVGIERVHMEEDTGKSTHVGASGRLHGADYSLIDYNRCGIPLLECVSRPDIRTPEQAGAFVRELQGIVRTLGISDARMEEGSLRCDANVSVRRAGEDFGTRCEIKNLNSTRSLARAIAYEAERQIHLLEADDAITQETRHWDEERGVTETLRRKEGVTDYRYFPDPDLVEVGASRDWVEQLRAGLPELPAAARSRLIDAGVDAPTAATVVSTGLLDYHDDAVRAGAAPEAAANWLTGEVAGQLNQRDISIDESGLTGGHVADLLAMIDDGRLSNNLAKDVLEGILDTGGEMTAQEIAADRGLEQISDESELRSIVEGIVEDDDNAETVEAIRGGNDKAIGALIGQVMGATQGQANPQLARQLITEAVGAPTG